MRYASARTPVVAIAALLVSVATILSPHALAADRAKNITFDDLKFELKKEDSFLRSMLGKQIEALNGKPVIVRGFMLPAYSAKVQHFVLVRDNLECCFGPGAALCDSIQVEMDQGKGAKYTIYQVAVEGVLTIREYKDLGIVRSVYHLQAVKVK